MLHQLTTLEPCNGRSNKNYSAVHCTNAFFLGLAFNNRHRAAIQNRAFTCRQLQVHLSHAGIITSDGQRSTSLKKYCCQV